MHNFKKISNSKLQNYPNFKIFLTSKFFYFQNFSTSNFFTNFKIFRTLKFFKLQNFSDFKIKKNFNFKFFKKSGFIFSDKRFTFFFQKLNLLSYYIIIAFRLIFFFIYFILYSRGSIPLKLLILQ